MHERRLIGLAHVPTTWETVAPIVAVSPAGLVVHLPIGTVLRASEETPARPLPEETVRAIARLVALLPVGRRELCLGCKNQGPVDLLAAMPGVHVTETLYPGTDTREAPYVIRCAEVTIDGLAVRAQHDREPTAEELARLDRARVDATPRIRPVHLTRTP
jgi:hypothetical protein